VLGRSKLLLFFSEEIMLESKFQSSLIKKIKLRFPGAIVLKTDPGHIRSFPDLLILNNNQWAALETKASRDASRRPNQEYYVKLLNDMAYSSFVYPKNQQEVLNGLGHWF
jgi:hypothetical protein